MNDIVSKQYSEREAVAQAVVRVSSARTMEALLNNTVPKGNVFEFAKVACLFAIKKTSEVIPDCHPLPIEGVDVAYATKGLEITIDVCVHTVYKTGVEVEAMHGASIAALTFYDMLKPIDTAVEIASVRLIRKSGGKSSRRHSDLGGLRAHVVVCSDRASQGVYSDTAGVALVEKLNGYGLLSVDYTLIPDDLEAIQQIVRKNEHDLVVFAGGTGVSSRDITPDAIKPLLDREIPGIMEAARAYGLQRNVFSMLSRGVAGLVGKALVVSLPGSHKGAIESAEAIFPAIFHVFDIIKDEQS